MNKSKLIKAGMEHSAVYGTFPGDTACTLQHTYGVPLELLEDILAGVGVKVDRWGFEVAMAVQRDISRGDKPVMYKPSPQMIQMWRDTYDISGLSEMILCAAIGLVEAGVVEEERAVEWMMAQKEARDG